jgi:hypothetical protein
MPEAGGRMTSRTTRRDAHRLVAVGSPRRLSQTAAGRAPTARDGPASTAADRVLGALLAGLLGGVALYSWLAVAAVRDGLGLEYPLRAVHALMSGPRVLPDYPRGSLGGAEAFDPVSAPLMFIVPALVVSLVTAVLVGRSPVGRDSPETVLVISALLTGLAFVVLVLLFGFRVADPQVQRISTGYGLRQLGRPAWAGAHLAYVAVLTVCLQPVTRWITRRRADSRPSRPLPGEEAPGHG